MKAGLRSTVADWIVIHENSARCERCGVSEAIPLPMELSKLPGWLNNFRDKHLGCKE